MSLLRNLEDKIAGLVEGTFGRVFRTQVRPVEIARKLAREMEEHKTVSVSRTYVPNEYVVWLGPEDRQRFEGVEDEVTDELSAYLLEHARREKLALVSRPQITFDTDERLRLGEFGIQARLVRAAAEAVEQADHGHTMVYSTAARAQEELQDSRSARRGRAVLVAEGKRYAVGPGGRHHRAQPRVRHRPGRHQRLAPARRAAAAGRWLDRHRPGLDQRRARQRARRARQRAARPELGRPGRDRHRRRALRGRLMAAVVVEPITVGLQFGFLAVLYLFLLWVSRSALKDLRNPPRRSVPAVVSDVATEATGLHPASQAGGRGGPIEPRLIVERAPGHTPGMEYDVGDGAVMGRGDQAEIRLEDPFASSRHAKLTPQGGIVVIEDLGSTNGTYLNEELLSGPQPLHQGDRVRIGDSEFTFADR